jgi:hypothetical protein
MVGSVYAPSPRNTTWLSLQKRFLDKTLGANYTHAVWLNRADPAVFKDVTVIGRSAEYREMVTDHAYGLKQLIECFAQDQEHEHYLILDSDAFPFSLGWLERMLTWMQEDSRLPERHWASAVRVENLDTFPHPCVMFFRGEWFHSFRNPAEQFDFGIHDYVNIGSYKFKDVGLEVYDNARNSLRCQWQPMTRTNVYNPHPILGAIYGGMFYHHGAGSRSLELRSVALRQFDHHVPRFNHVSIERALWLEISKNPELFIRQLHNGGQEQVL